VITSNAHKYPISAQCDILGIARSTYYFYRNNPPKGRIDAAVDEALSKDVERIYKKNRSVYGARKIKQKLDKEGKPASRKRIVRVMKSMGITSAYTKKKYKPQKDTPNEAKTKNLVDRKFSGHLPLDVLVSDLTYVRVANRWAYTCLFLDLANRELVGHAAGPNKNGKLVKAAFASMDANLYDVDIFHTDRGGEFDNMDIDELLDFFGIRRSLSRKANPWDNAVAEATFKLYKAEFVYRESFGTIEELQVKLSEYVHWFNNVRIHSTLGYLTPVEFKKNGLIISSS
jgi:transposase InsO family protein